MNLRQSESKRIVHAPAKLNLLLDVFDRDPAGYHDLATLMVPVRLFDSLSFEPVRPVSGGPGKIEFSLRSNEADGGIPRDASNLVVRALELLRLRSGCELGARAELVKRIPSAAGLGGGSSDAAAALKVANHGWGLDWSNEALAPLAAELGSDVPFFLESRPAICRGRGERVEALPQIMPLEIVLVKPPVELSTAAVYRTFDQLPAVNVDNRRTERAMGSLAEALERSATDRMREWMGNALQRAAAVLSTWVARVAAAFSRLDFVAHQLTGSGSAYFGICRHAGHARRLAATLRSRQLGTVLATRSFG